MDKTVLKKRCETTYGADVRAAIAVVVLTSLAAFLALELWRIDLWRIDLCIPLSFRGDALSKGLHLQGKTKGKQRGQVFILDKQHGKGL